MNDSAPYTVCLTAAARRRLDKRPLPVAAALFEQLTGPVAANPHRLVKSLDTPFDQVRSVRRGEYRTLYTVDDDHRRRNGVVSGRTSAGRRG